MSDARRERKRHGRHSFSALSLLGASPRAGSADKALRAGRDWRSATRLAGRARAGTEELAKAREAGRSEVRARVGRVER